MPARDAADARALTEGARDLGIELSPDTVPLLLRFLDFVYGWNRSTGLTTVPREDAVRLHLLDSLSIARFFRAGDRIADLGSGAGLPGIPLAVSVPAAHVTLVETRRRKCSFLREAVRETGLSNVHILERDARKLVAERLYDAVVARAFLPPADLVELATGLIPKGGRIVIMGGRRTADLDSLAADRHDIVRTADVSFTLPGGAEQRRVLVLEKRDAGDACQRP